ncbi:hypothetical protein BDZ45DRAFT_750821 [Acephala macrosclerotiorum]|nr:hypothetical protein BDZ45DRAFT_750821 [Acephala macrosclerotiorum]
MSISLRQQSNSPRLLHRYRPLGSNCSVTDPSKLLYTPAFLASCPFVTAVGATYHVIPEIAVSLSGGSRTTSLVLLTKMLLLLRTSTTMPMLLSSSITINPEEHIPTSRLKVFLNPWLYTTAASALTDIAGGKGSGCGAQIPGSGFPAVVGWDPVTGLGTPDFKKLRLASTRI